MSDEIPESLPAPSGDTWLARLRELTPARIFQSRSGLSYRTATQLDLRTDHAAARDAVHAELVLNRDFPTEFVSSLSVLEIETQAASREQFLRRPDLGRKLSSRSRQLIEASCPRNIDVQVVIGDGLSAKAVSRQCPELLPRLLATAGDCGWSLGRILLIHRCRVGVINDIGDLLAPKVVVLLIGERPGLATAESLSAYLAYRPSAGDTDARRNLISNIHERGVSIESAVVRLVALIAEMMRQERSGYELKESLPLPRLNE
jgi:ethanolamine ammonia-lyase small subunit